MANINRDYLIVNDVKKSNITLDNGSMFFYITDKNTQNIFVNLVINISNNDLIQKYANIENAEDYTLTMNIVKPDNTYKIIEGKLHDKEKAIFEFNLEEDCCDEIGTYRCELLTKCNINDHEEITTSNKLTYKVKSSVLNDLDDIVEAPEYPLVIQLFDKLSDIEQYEEDRRANELARQLAEEQRQARFDTLDTDIDNKIAEAVVNHIPTKTSQLTNDSDFATNANVDDKIAEALSGSGGVDLSGYVTKDIGNANQITFSDGQTFQAKLDAGTLKGEKGDTGEQGIQGERGPQGEQGEQGDQGPAGADGRDGLTTAIVVNGNTYTHVDGTITLPDYPIVPTNISAFTNDSNYASEAYVTSAIEAINTAQNTRLNAIEAKNQQQDDRLLAIERVNERQDADLEILLGDPSNDMTEITKRGNSIYLQNSVAGHCEIDNIQGNTLVNCNKEPNKQLILNGDINTSAVSSVTLTEGVNGGKVDVALEGNTLVNVSKTKNSTAITKAYTVENSGNHIAFPGNVDSSYRPVVTGNTLVNSIDIKGNENTSGNTAHSTVTDTEFIFDWSKGQSYNNWIQVRNNVNLIQEGKTYTIIINILENNPTLDGVEVKGEMLFNTWFNGFNVVNRYIPYGTTGLYKYTFSAVRNSTQTRNMIGIRVNSKEDNVPSSAILMNGGKLRISKDILVLEGNYINKPMPDYFEGLQSTFEDNLVTQEMVDSAEEVADNLDKYKVEYKSIQENGTVGSTKTLYLNSPLLKGDTIEEKDNGIYHVHRSELVAYTEGDEASLITDKVNTLHGLETPTYELIEQSNLVVPSYANGHLDFNTAVPVEKVEFKAFSEELTYLYPNTQYTVQFMSDKATTADITLGGTLLLAQNIVQGLNKITITTPSELVDNKLLINGAGTNISEVVVTDTDREFRYFEGMKSVGEGGNLVITSSNSDNSLSNTQTLTHAPLRSVGETKDRYVLLNGNWYIERKCGIRAHQEGDKDNYKTDLINTIYPLEMPSYDEIDYNPLEVYSGTTRITTNSTVPTNIIVKNHGFNCLLKPSTTYTISSNLGLNTVTTPAELTEDCLRFMDTDTSDVTTMKDVLILEGDWTTKADSIPANFSGIESAFEQELVTDIEDEHHGKYKVNVKVTNENVTAENNMALYINEPLRGIGSVKDKIYVKDNKVVVERKCGARAYQDGDFGTYPTDKVNTVYPLTEPVYEEVQYNGVKLSIEIFKNSTLSYNSNVAVTSTVRYSYSVPIVDTVAQTANVTDQQDQLIIDLATQCAVMEMMLM